MNDVWSHTFYQREALWTFHIYMFNLILQSAIAKLSRNTSDCCRNKILSHQYTSFGTPEACAAHAFDFEDCLQATCAKANPCFAIVIRDEKGFHGFGIPLLSPALLVEQYKTK